MSSATPGSTRATVRGLSAAACASLLAGCNWVVLNPSGDVAVQQGRLVVQSTVLMLLIIVPVIVLTLLFAWHYRASNKAATYKPEWDHSVALELLIWAAPLLIIIALGALTWIGTHTLDPFRSLRRTDAERRAPPTAPTLDIEVVALDWKWLFIYPEYGIAVVNEVAAPVDRPIRFRITSSTVMNSFFVPALAGQIYAMPGMETRLHAIINRPGNYEGFSANYSGAGFSDMRFRFLGLDAAGFEQWIGAARSAGGELGRDGYLQLAAPSEKQPVRRFAGVEPRLYDRVVNRCVAPGTTCMRDMMAMDGRRRTLTALAPPDACSVDDPEGIGRATAATRD